LRDRLDLRLLDDADPARARDLGQRVVELDASDDPPDRGHKYMILRVFSTERHPANGHARHVGARVEHLEDLVAAASHRAGAVFVARVTRLFEEDDAIDTRRSGRGQRDCGHGPRGTATDDDDVDPFAAHGFVSELSR
jgi:hypothetical protein